MLTFKSWTLKEGLLQAVSKMVTGGPKTQKTPANLANRIKRVAAGSDPKTRNDWMGKTTWHQRQPLHKEDMSSAIPTNNAGSGNVDGIGVGLKGEPGFKKKKKKKNAD